MNDTCLSQTLKHSLANWTDVDTASYFVAVALGVAPAPDGQLDSWGGKKWMFWSANPLGEGLYQVLEMLAANGVLEKDDAEMKFRWNSGYDWAHYRDAGAKV